MNINLVDRKMKLLLLLCSVLYATSHGEEFTEPIREVRCPSLPLVRKANVC